VNFEDNGKGLPAAARDGEAQGFGLKNLFQRIEDLGGTVTLASDTGTTIVLRVPLLLNIRPPEPGVQPPMAALDSQP
jgi:glucose-6-phosphate-specific signal transduction histidine kinase